MRVLSLFDGISCGRVALEREGFQVDEYNAFEIDKYAIEVSEHNYSDIIHHGDVFQGDFSQFKGCDLLLGGSPCTYWSIARQGRETSSDGLGFKLFMQYVTALKESGCKYFLYENNYSMHKNIKEEITQHLGVQPIMINSALVSAQQRKRLYWTNIPNVQEPDDKGILLEDVLETPDAIGFATINGKAHTLTASYYKIAASPFSDFGSEAHRQRVAIRVDGGVPIAEQQDATVFEVHFGQVLVEKNGKQKIYPIDLPDGDYIFRKLSVLETERLQTLPDGYTDCGISNMQRYKCIGNGWTVDVIGHILKNLKGVVK